MAVTAVLLAAGYATRLYPLTHDQPKALLPLDQGVILDEILRSLETVPGLAQRILVTNHRFAPKFQQWQQARGCALTLVDDGSQTPEERLGAIRDLALTRKVIDAESDLLVIGTDNLFRWPLGEFVARAQQVWPAPSVALWNAASRQEATAFGVVTRDPSGRITSFVEKSSEPPSAEVALCVYYLPAPMRSRIELFLTEGGNPDAPGYFIQWLARCGTVYGVMMPGPWYDIGSLEAYQEVLKEWNEEVG